MIINVTNPITMPILSHLNENLSFGVMSAVFFSFVSVSLFSFNPCIIFSYSYTSACSESHLTSTCNVSALIETTA